MAKLSIVVIIYNKQKYIRACLDSILAQPLPEKEIICVDDGSVDGTVDILKEYASAYSEITLVLHERNKGTCEARYSGLKQCTGSYMTWIDADDEYVGGKLQELCRIAGENAVDILEFGCEVSPCSSEAEKQAERLKSYLMPEESVRKNINFCESCYVHRNISNFLFNKLYSRSIYTKALKVMQNREFSNLSDVLYFLWHFLFFAESYQGVPMIAYRYYAGRGMTYHKDADIRRLADYCDARAVCGELEMLVKRFHKEKEYASVFRKLRSYCRMQAVRCWIEAMPLEQMQAGYEMLMQCYGSNDVCICLAQLYWNEFHRVGSVLENLDWRAMAPEGNGAACLLREEMTEAEAEAVRQKAEVMWQNAETIWQNADAMRQKTEAMQQKAEVIWKKKADRANGKLVMLAGRRQTEFWAGQADEDVLVGFEAPSDREHYAERSWKLKSLLACLGAAVLYLPDCGDPLTCWDGITAASMGVRVVFIPAV